MIINNVTKIDIYTLLKHTLETGITYYVSTFKNRGKKIGKLMVPFQLYIEHTTDKHKQEGVDGNLYTLRRIDNKDIDYIALTNYTIPFEDDRLGFIGRGMFKNSHTIIISSSSYKAARETKEFLEELWDKTYDYHGFENMNFTFSGLPEGRSFEDSPLVDPTQQNQYLESLEGKEIIYSIFSIDFRKLFWNDKNSEAISSIKCLKNRGTIIPSRSYYNGSVRPYCIDSYNPNIYSKPSDISNYNIISKYLYDESYRYKSVIGSYNDINCLSLKNQPYDRETEFTLLYLSETEEEHNYLLREAQKVIRDLINEFFVQISLNKYHWELDQGFKLKNILISSESANAARYECFVSLDKINKILYPGKTL